MNFNAGTWGEKSLPSQEKIRFKSVEEPVHTQVHGAQGVGSQGPEGIG